MYVHVGVGYFILAMQVDQAIISFSSQADSFCASLSRSLKQVNEVDFTKMEPHFEKHLAI